MRLGGSALPGAVVGVHGILVRAAVLVPAPEQDPAQLPARLQALLQGFIDCLVCGPLVAALAKLHTACPGIMAWLKGT